MRLNGIQGVAGSKPPTRDAKGGSICRLSPLVPGTVSEDWSAQMSETAKPEDPPTRSRRSLQQQVLEEFLDRLREEDSILTSTENVFQPLSAIGLMDRKEIVAQVRKAIEDHNDPT